MFAFQVGALNDYLLPHEPEKVKGRGLKRTLENAKQSPSEPGKSHPKHGVNSASLSAPVMLDPKLPEALLHVPSSSDSGFEEIRCSLIAVADAALSAASAARAAAAAAMACCCLLVAAIVVCLWLVWASRCSDCCRCSL